jgi:hypothetical protein
MHISIKTPIECRILHEKKKYAGQPFRKKDIKLLALTLSSYFVVRFKSWLSDGELKLIDSTGAS